MLVQCIHNTEKYTKDDNIICQITKGNQTTMMNPNKRTAIIQNENDQQINDRIQSKV